MSQMRKSLFVSAILRGHCLFPRCLLNPTAIQKIALSEEGLRFSLDGCYVGMDSDALYGSVGPGGAALPVSCHTPYSQDWKCNAPHLQPAPSQPRFKGPSLGQGKDSPECSLEVQNPAPPGTPMRTLDVGMDEGR